MNSVFIKLTGNERHKISDEFEFRSYLTSHFGITCPSAVKKNDVSSFSQSPLIRSLSNLQVMRRSIKAWMSSNLGRIRLFTLELFDLERRIFFPLNGENDVSTFSQLLWIQFSSNLQVTRTGIKSWLGSNSDQVWPVTLVLHAHEQWNKMMAPAFLNHLWSDICQTCR